MPKYTEAFFNITHKPVTIMQSIIFANPKTKVIPYVLS